MAADDRATKPLLLLESDRLGSFLQRNCDNNYAATQKSLGFASSGSPKGRHILWGFTP
jgi:hypothetical protein